MYLLAISGGADSMFLLNEYKKKKIVVAHVNYNLRKTSNRDEKIVRDFCSANNIKIEVLNVSSKPTKNLEAWARTIRYDFFQKIYSKYNAKALLTGHHKDDFLETALMQQRSNREPKYFGIKKHSKRNGMVITRPWINLYWKSDILNEINLMNIKFGEDESNLDETFTRNKIRKEIKTWSIKEKNSHMKWFKWSNKILIKKSRKVESWLSLWAKRNYSTKYFTTIPVFKKEIIFEFIHQHYDDVSLSSKKIISIIDFIEGQGGNKKFKLNDKYFLLKKEGLISRL